MTIRHHPGSATLAEFAFGTLDSGRWFVVAAHVGACRQCRQVVAAYEEAGGVFLEDTEPAQMSAAAADTILERVLAEQSRGGPPVSARPAIDLGEVLRTHKDGPWRWRGPGVHYRPVADAGAGAARVFLLKAAPGTGLPQHSHSGSELTLVLSGAFAHHAGRFGPGDFEEADSSVEHQPMVEEGEACVCLVAMDGKLRLSGLIGRLMQPFVRL